MIDSISMTDVLSDQPCNVFLILRDTPVYYEWFSPNQHNCFQVQKSVLGAIQLMNVQQHVGTKRNSHDTALRSILHTLHILLGHALVQPR